ncbi:MAG: aspartate ammonia-lyase [Acidobacteria bacterium]|nr:aspartate ammonia-lyase [Acidobacteriota bacterium]
MAIENKDGESLMGDFSRQARENFPLSRGKPFPELIHALFQVKLACLETNFHLGFLPESVFGPCRNAIADGLDGKLDENFDVTLYQGGAGTSLNMMVNEAVAGRAVHLYGGRAEGESAIHPILHVNLHQSTNDVVPTAGRVAAIFLVYRLEKVVLMLQEALQRKERQFEEVVKPGRTQFQEAFPITLGREFSAYASAVARDRWRVSKLVERLREVNLGGTAIGTGALAPAKYIFRVVESLKHITGFPIARCENLVDGTQNTDVLVEVHGILTAFAATLIKISGDLRLMSSGPEHGFGEIRLKKVQAGSSIMPGKVNPVIPEFVTACALRVTANHQMLTTAASMGSLELNPFGLIMIHGLLESLTFLLAAAGQLAFCVDTASANTEKLSVSSRSDSIVIHVLAGRFGYEKAEEILHDAAVAGEKVAEYVVKSGLVSKGELDYLLSPENILKLGF